MKIDRRPSSHALAVIGLLAACLSARTAGAQTAQRYAFQLSVLTSGLRSGSVTIPGIGAEPQLRANLVWLSERLSGVSVGVGAQWTRHTEDCVASTGSECQQLTISGLFIEPRYVLTGNNRLYPYLSARLGLLRQSNNFGTSSSGTSFGAGGGIAIKLTNELNLDAGVQAVRQQFGDFRYQPSNAGGYFNPFVTYAAKIGFTLGFPK